MRTIQEIKKQLGMRTPKISIGFHVFGHNQGSIEEARRLHREWGADGISFSASFVSSQAEERGVHASTIERFNLYGAKGLRASTEPCSWLWGAIVANPSGSISPCCGIVDERSDFEKDARGRSLLRDVWNNGKYTRARAGALKHRHSTGTPVHLVKDGMALSSVASATETDLICERCPIPFRQNYVDRMIDKLGSDALAKARHGKTIRSRARSLAAFMLMGMPRNRGTDAGIEE
jgi:hypothetical protein